MARFHPGCTGWMIYCPRLEAYWQWKTVWRFPRAYGGFKEQPEVRDTREEIESAFLESHWWDRGDPETPQFEWYAVPAEQAQHHRIQQLQTLVDETPDEIQELVKLDAEDHAQVLRKQLEWYREELEGLTGAEQRSS